MDGFLGKQAIDQFIYDGYVRIDDAFSTEMARVAVDILWKDIPADRNDPGTWNAPVVRLGMYSQPPFTASINNKKLHGIFDQLIGPDKWYPRDSVGTFPVRFPSDQPPNDDGKHVDASFPGDDPTDFLSWRVNYKSRGRALLMLFLYTDVGESDAPTIIYKASHMDVARLLEPEGDQGLGFMELAAKLDTLPYRETALATGKAGTVYLCHPFIVHAAQAHRGNNPKFMAQPSLTLKSDLVLEGSSYYSPLEQSIQMAIDSR